MQVATKVPVFVASVPAFPHIEKMAVIAEGLIAHGHSVTFITGRSFQDSVERLGADFEPIAWSQDALDADEMAAYLAFTDPLEREAFGLRHLLLKRVPVHHAELQRIFTRFRATHGAEATPVLVYDAAFLGAGPVMLGAEGIRPRTIAVGHFPVTLASIDTFPVFTGRHPDTSDGSRQRHRAEQQKQDAEPFFASINAALDETMASAGATRSPDRFYDAITTLGDRFAHLGIPDFEYPRTDLPASFSHIGSLPTVGLQEEWTLPAWWDEVRAAHTQGKTIVAVTSSSAEFNVRATIFPALEGLQDRKDTLVVATLVNHDPDQFEHEFPANARVARFIPLDILLPYVSCLSFCPLALPPSLYKKVNACSLLELGVRHRHQWRLRHCSTSPARRRTHGPERRGPR
jgi:hypothetical protein